MAFVLLLNNYKKLEESGWVLPILPHAQYNARIGYILTDSGNNMRWSAMPQSSGSQSYGGYQIQKILRSSLKPWKQTKCHR